MKNPSQNQIRECGVSASRPPLDRSYEQPCDDGEANLAETSKSHTANTADPAERELASPTTGNSLVETSEIIDFLRSIGLEEAADCVGTAAWEWACTYSSFKSPGVKSCAWPGCQELNGGRLQKDLLYDGEVVRKAGELLRDPYCCGDHARNHLYEFEALAANPGLKEGSRVRIRANDHQGQPQQHAGRLGIVTSMNLAHKIIRVLSIEPASFGDFIGNFWPEELEIVTKVEQWVVTWEVPGRPVSMAMVFDSWDEAFKRLSAQKELGCPNLKLTQVSVDPNAVPPASLEDTEVVLDAWGTEQLVEAIQNPPKANQALRDLMAQRKEPPPEKRPSEVWLDIDDLGNILAVNTNKVMSEAKQAMGIHVVGPYLFDQDELVERLDIEKAAFNRMEAARDCLKRQKARMQALAQQILDSDCEEDHDNQ